MLSERRWLSPMDAVKAAERKPYQLRVAADLGLVVPPTLITNDPSELAHFASGREIVAKAVSSGYIAEPEGNQAIFTSLVKESDLSDLEGLTLAPVTFQEHIRKRFDVRVTVVGTAVFAARILSQEHESSSIDWRATRDPQLRHERHELPRSIQAKCIELVHRLGLAYGAIDLAVSRDGTYIFFEINPNGEWVWIQEQLDYPIADTIADWLVGAID